MKREIKTDKALNQPMPTKTTFIAREAIQDLNSAFESWVKISLDIFPKATPQGGMIHAQKECQEVIDELNNSKHEYEDLALEYADILMCVSDSMKRAGVSIGDVVFAMFHKAETNKNRKWIYNDDGSYSHIKE